MALSFRPALLGAALLGFGGCGWLTPPATTSGLALPAGFASATPGAPVAWPDRAWWRGFGSPELDGLMEAALAANNDLGAAVARIRQADAQARIAGAALLPTLDLTPQVTRQQSGSASSASIAGLGRTTKLRVSAVDRLTLTAGYELDFWGKNRAATEAAQQALLASRFALGTVTLTTQASVANTYFALLAAQERLALQQQNLDISQRVLAVIRDRVTVGTGTGLDLAQQETVVAQQQARVPPLAQDLEQNRNSLGTLVAQAPSALRINGGVFNRLDVPRPAPGLPVDVLARRPDVLTAEADLAAANADIVAARAQLLPAVQLSANGGFSSLVLENLLRPGSTIFTLTGSLTQPIFRGGALRAQVDQSEGRGAELLAIYRGAILTALVDTENAMVALRQTTEQERLAASAVRMAERAYAISEAQLRAGTIDLVTLLNTQQTLFTARDTLAIARLARLQAAVGLFRALGGGWGTI